MAAMNNGKIRHKRSIIKLERKGDNLWLSLFWGAGKGMALSMILFSVFRSISEDKRGQSSFTPVLQGWT